MDVALASPAHPSQGEHKPLPHKLKPAATSLEYTRACSKHEANSRPHIHATSPKPLSAHRPQPAYDEEAGPLRSNPEPHL